jgi:hypothetical protein
MHERRAFPRYQVSVAGKLVSPDMSCCVDIEIRDLSEDGAFVSSKVPVSLPDRIYLWEAKRGTIFECAVRWRRLDRFFGLQFTDSASRARRRALIEAATSPSLADRPQAVARPRLAVSARKHPADLGQQRTA